MPAPDDFKKLPFELEARLKEISTDHGQLVSYRTKCARDLLPFVKHSGAQINFLFPAEQVVPGKTLKDLYPEGSERLGIYVKSLLGIDFSFRRDGHFVEPSRPLEPLNMFTYALVDTKPDEMDATAQALSKTYDDVEPHPEAENVMYVKNITTSKDFHTALVHGKEHPFYYRSSQESADREAHFIDYFAEGRPGAELIDRLAQFERDKNALATDLEKAGYENGSAMIDQYIADKQVKY